MAWTPGKQLELHIFVDKQFVEIFANGGQYCVSRRVRVQNIKGNRISLTSLGGTARLISFKAWELKAVN